MTDNTDALPPLPASQAFSLTRSVYTADDMHAYARAALASRDAELEALKHDIEEALKTIGEYDAELAKLRQGEPVAWRYKDARGHWRYVGTQPGPEHVILKPEPLYASHPPAQPPREPVQPLSEEDIVRCAVESGCIGTVKMTFDSGPYEITRTSINADRFARAIERLINERAGRGT